MDEKSVISNSTVIKHSVTNQGRKPPRKEKEMTILIGADIVPTKSNQIYFEQAQMDQIVDKGILDIINHADYRIFNLEVPLTDFKTPIKKCGPNLIASTKTVAGIKQLKVDFLTLANNHILDQDVQGMWSTTQQLDKVGISYAGVGNSVSEASKPHIFEIDGKKIGIYCCAEHEFSIVKDGRAGANPYDPLESFDHIVELKSHCDYIIVLYHGGKEHYRYPSPNLQRVCHKFVEKGANLVVCQHSHCIGCEEVYMGSTIVYGQGNFIFDGSDSDFWQTSLLIRIDDWKISYIPIKKDGNGISLADEVNASQIMDAFRLRSEEIEKPGMIEAYYSEFADSFLGSYLAIAAAKDYHLPMIALNKLAKNKLINGLMKRKYSQKKRLALENKLACEAHIELFLEGLRKEK